MKHSAVGAVSNILCKIIAVEDNIETEKNRIGLAEDAIEEYKKRLSELYSLLRQYDVIIEE